MPIRTPIKATAALAAAAMVLMTAPPAAAGPPSLDWGALPLPALNGGSHPADLFRGKVVLVVNTASHCGFTPQYDALQALWTRYRDRGFVVLGVPSNDFGGQEPGTAGEIADFCRINYGVDFPLLEKQRVTGTDAHPLYRWAADATGFIGQPRWNFHKLLVGRDGRLVDWFSSITAPDSGKVTAAIEAALAQPDGGT